jgi:hypothetical protein
MDIEPFIKNLIGAKKNRTVRASHVSRPFAFGHTSSYDLSAAQTEKLGEAPTTNRAFAVSVSSILRQKFGQIPHVIGDSRLHRGRHPQGAMNSAKVVIGEVQAVLGKSCNRRSAGSTRPTDSPTSLRSHSSAESDGPPFTA